MFMLSFKWVYIMTCINHKIRTKKGIKYGYCILLKKEVPIFNCKCEERTYKETKPLKTKTNKQAKKEAERFSIIYKDLSKCCINGCTNQEHIDKNEVFGGSYRSLSIKYGAVCPLCNTHHKQFHNDRKMNLYFKSLFQKKLVEKYGYGWFMKTFKKDYIYLFTQYKKEVK